jgi:hypothetical protein
MMRYWEAVNAIHQMYGIPDAGFGEVHDSFNSLEHLRSHVADLELRDRINEARKKSLEHRLADRIGSVVVREWVGYGLNLVGVEK